MIYQNLNKFMSLVFITLMLLVAQVANAAGVAITITPNANAVVGALPPMNANPNLLNFTDPKTVIVNLDATTPTSAGETVTITIPAGLAIAPVTLTPVQSAFISSINQTATDITLNFITGTTFNTNIALSANFPGYLADDGQIATLSVADSLGTPVSIDLVEWNPSQYEILTNNGAPIANATVSSTIVYFPMIKAQNNANYTTAGGGKFNGANITLTYTVPNEVTAVALYPGVGATASYSAPNITVTFNPANYESSVKVDLTYDGTLTAGNPTTGASVSVNSAAVAGGATTDTVTTKPFTDLSYNNTSLATNMLPLGGTAVATPPTQINFAKGGFANFYTNAPNTKLFNIGFTRNVGVDFTNFSFDVAMPDGMYINNFNIPASSIITQNGNSQWTGTLNITYTTHSGASPTSSITANAVQAGTLATPTPALATGDYITSAHFAFSDFRSTDLVTSYPSDNVVFPILAIGRVGSVDGLSTPMHWDGITPLANGDTGKVVISNVTADYPTSGTTHTFAVGNVGADILAGATTSTITYQTQAVSNATVYGVKFYSDAAGAARTSNLFKQGDTGFMGFYLGPVEYPYSTAGIGITNTNTLATPLVYFAVDKDLVVTGDATVLYNGATSETVTPTLVTGAQQTTATANGKVLYSVQLTKSMDALGAGGFPTGATVELPFTVSTTAIPGTFYTLNSNIGSKSTAFITSSDPNTKGVVTGYGTGTATDVYNISAVAPAIPSYGQSQVADYVITATGFFVYDGITSNYDGVEKPSYTAGDLTSASNFVQGNDAGTYSIHIINNDANLGNFVYYSTLPKNSYGSTQLTGPVNTAVAGYTITYTTAATPSRAELTGGTDPAGAYVVAASIVDWSKVTGIKVNVASIASGTIGQLDFPIKTALAANTAANYNQAITQSVASQYKSNASVNTYTVTPIAATFAGTVIAGKVYVDAARAGTGISGANAGLSGITVNVYDSADTTTPVATATTDSTGAYLVDVATLVTTDTYYVTYGEGTLSSDYLVTNTGPMAGINQAVSGAIVGSNTVATTVASSLLANTSYNAVDLGVAKVQYPVTVNYVYFGDMTTVLHPMDTFQADVGSTYTAQVIAIAGYSYHSQVGNPVLVTNGTNDITLYYVKGVAKIPFNNLGLVLMLLMLSVLGFVYINRRMN